MKLATLCYVRSGCTTLMLHRIKKAQDMHAGKWNGLGGKLEPGESPEECVVREVEEESGLRLIAPLLKGVISFPKFNGGEDWYTFIYIADRFSGTLIDSSEGVLEWVDNERLLELNLWEGDCIFIPWLAEPRYFSAKFEYHAGKLTNYQVVFYTQDGNTESRSESLLEDAAKVASSYTGYKRVDDTYCWVCGADVLKRHCKIICTTCGFTRDCSDP
jgi:8-oxo-dGTP diphosphatase